MKIVRCKTKLFIVALMLIYGFYIHHYRTVLFYLHDLYNLGKVSFVRTEAASINNLMTTKPQNRTKVILLWNNYFSTKHFGFGLGKDAFGEKCSQTYPLFSNYCSTTEDRSMIVNADAVVVHLRNKWVIPRNVAPEQKWVFFLNESPVYSPHLTLQKLNDIFHWSMTYRLDSDILLWYGGVPVLIANDDNHTSRNNASEKHEQMISAVRGKTKLAAWFASNCKTNSKREFYVTELQKFIKVDVYGACGSLKCSGGVSKNFCMQMLEREYKFYLAFENSICRDYVTEKLFSVLDYYVVPVVMGGANYSQVAPPHSVINVNDFRTAEELARYLIYLDKHDEAYEKYFQWKETHKMRPTINPFCKLCYMLHTRPANDTPRYTDLFNWWVIEGKCVAPNETWRGLSPFYHSLV